MPSHDCPNLTTARHKALDGCDIGFVTSESFRGQCGAVHHRLPSCFFTGFFSLVVALRVWKAKPYACEACRVLLSMVARLQAPQSWGRNGATPLPKQVSSSVQAAQLASAQEHQEPVRGLRPVNR